MQHHLESPWLETASNSNIMGAVWNHLSKEQHKHQPASKEDVWMSFKEPEELFLKTICRNERLLCYRINVVVPKNDFQGCLNCTNTVFVRTRFNTLMDGNKEMGDSSRPLQLLRCSLALQWIYNLTSDNTTLWAPSPSTPSISWLWWCDRKCSCSIFLLMSGRLSGILILSSYHPLLQDILVCTECSECILWPRPADNLFL